MTLRRDARDLTGGALLALVGGALAIVVVLALAMMAVFGFGLFSQKSANFRGETSKRNQVEANGAFRIAAYDSFYNECASIQAIEGTVAALKAERDGTPKPTPERVHEIAVALTANVATRAAAIAQYNADARKSYTSGQFRASDLPYQLDTTTEETQCHA